MEHHYSWRVRQYCALKSGASASFCVGIATDRDGEPGTDTRERALALVNHNKTFDEIFEKHQAGWAAFFKISDDMAGGRIGHTQFHLLNFLGTSWGGGEIPRFPDVLTISWTKYILEYGGAVTWDIPTSATGVIPEKILETLMKL